MLAFISSPYKSVFDKVKDKGRAHSLALQYARTACKWAADIGYVPISPVLLFDGVFTEDDREQITQMCAQMVKKCEAFIYCQTPYTQESGGMAFEQDLAECENKLIIDAYFENPLIVRGLKTPPKDSE